MTPSLPPLPDGPASLSALRALLPDADLLAALTAFHQRLGDVFQVQAPGLRMTVMVGAEAGRFLYVTERENLLWRQEQDGITRLLRHGVLVEDGKRHDDARHLMDPALHHKVVGRYAAAMLRYADQVIDGWEEGRTYDMAVEMRKIALLVIFDTLFGVDATPDLARLWQPVHKALNFISPGLWMLWPDIPRPGYARPLAVLDAYLYSLISQRRRNSGGPSDDLLGLLLGSGLTDDDIRDQLMTMVIAGHDTSAALWTWALWLLGNHTPVVAQIEAEIEQELGGEMPTAENAQRLRYLEQVVKESLRLYPPAHASLRRANADLTFQDFFIPAGSRILFSIYLTQRHPAHWAQPDAFLPERFAPDSAARPVAFSYLPFGAGPRNCMGGSYGRLEAQIVLGRLFQRCRLTLRQRSVHMHMGAAIEPRPGIFMTVQKR